MEDKQQDVWPEAAWVTVEDLSPDDKPPGKVRNMVAFLLAPFSGGKRRRKGRSIGKAR